MRILSYFFICICGFCPLYAQLQSVSGSAGINLSIPFIIEERFIPSVSVQSGVPLKLYPEADIPAFHGAVKLQWQNGIVFFAGDLSFSKTVSLFKSPSFTLVMNPLSSFSIPDPGLGTAFSDKGVTRKPFAAALIIPLGNSKKILSQKPSIQCAGDESGSYVSVLRLPFEIMKMKCLYAVSVCSYKLESTVADASARDSWFAEDAVFTDNGDHINSFLQSRYIGFAQEFSIQTRMFKTYGTFGISESPFGNFSGWGRFLGHADMGRFSLSGGFYCGDFDIIGMNGSRVRSSVQGFMQPVFFCYENRKTVKILRLGCKFAVNGRNSGGYNSYFFADGKVSAGAECVFDTFSLRTVAVWNGFPLYGGTDGAAAMVSEYVSGTVSAAVRIPAARIFYIYNAFNGSAGIRYYPAKGSGSDKFHITYTISAEPDVRGLTPRMRFFPSVSAGSEISINGSLYKGIKSDISLSWSILAGYVRIKGNLVFAFSI